MGIIKIFLKSLADFIKDNGHMLAGAVSFFFMLALVPYCLMLVAIFGYFLGERPDFFMFFAEKLGNMFPSVTHKITEGLTNLITYRKIGNITLVLYAFLSYELLSSLEFAMDKIFKVKHSRHFLLSLILSVVIVTITIAIIFLSFSSTYLVASANEIKRLLPNFDVGFVTSFILGYVIPFLIIFLTLTSLYIILPNKRIKITHAMLGALLSTIFLELAKHIFTIYVNQILQIGAIYGPLTAFVILLIWIYYSCCILLIGGEFIHNLDSSQKRTKR
ncbi:MAG: YihY/virulence factor BrkB family protein [Thermodesulfovibrionales bacterium]|nr:YihY/virulence factor BrkB family protein [Thermodesulfovibrionales bacterium]